MTIITATQFRANQSKYIDMANRGERVILSSKSGYAELKPVDKDDEEIKKHNLLATFFAVAPKVRQEYEEGKGITLKTHEDIDNYFNSL